MEKKKRWLINFLYYGIIFSIGCLIVYILFKKCLIVVLSYLSAILLKPFIDLILEKLHIKNKVFSIIMTIIIFILLYTCFFLFVFFSCLFFIKTLSFLPSFIETVYQELLSHQYLISFFTQFSLDFHRGGDVKRLPRRFVLGRIRHKAQSLLGDGVGKGERIRPKRQLPFLRQRAAVTHIPVHGM